MKCPRCQAESPDDARFCEDCGARLNVTCTACGQPVGADKRFCRSCGAPLPIQPIRFAAPESYTPRFLAERILASRSALEGERKRAEGAVTVPMMER